MNPDRADAHIRGSLSDERGPIGHAGGAAYNRAMATRVKPAAVATPLLSVVVLVYNEAESIAPMHEELIGGLESMDVTHEVGYIDDGSRDGSTERLPPRTPHAPPIFLARFSAN